MALAFAVVTCGASLPAGLGAVRAHAADDVYVSTYRNLGFTELKTEIEALTDAYEKAQSIAVSCDIRAAATQKRIDVLEAKLETQQQRSDAATVELYKMQQDRYGIIEMLLGSESLDDFIAQTEYVSRIGRANVKTIVEMRETRERLAAAYESLEAAKAESDAVLNIASDALNAALAAREEKQREYQNDSGASPDGADWTMSEEEFVATWAPPINAYFEGSPMAGTGEAFARASWRYCVDPRWSPAISNTESSKGAYCIRPYNAWGWGAADSDPYGLASEWGSWEEAIDTHVRGLAEGYGYTISQAAAEKYCSSPEEWYMNTKSEMEKISL